MTILISLVYLDGNGSGRSSRWLYSRSVRLDALLREFSKLNISLQSGVALGIPFADAALRTLFRVNCLELALCDTRTSDFFLRVEDRLTARMALGKE